MSIYWRGYTTAGAVSSILSGAVTSLVLISISPTILVDVLGHEDAVIGLKNPALISMPVAFGLGIVVSLIWPEREAQRRFVEAERQIVLGAPEVSRLPSGASPARAR
jgi:cation/acetate symporter